MTKDLLLQIAKEQDLDPIDFLLRECDRLQSGREPEYVCFEFQYVDPDPSDNDDAAAKAFIDAYPADEDGTGTVIAAVTRTKGGEIVVDWHHNGYRTDERVLDLIAEARRVLTDESAARDAKDETPGAEDGGDDEYVVSLAVDGRYYAHVRAGSPREAMDKGNEACAEADFGDLEAIDWSVDHVEDPDGNFIDPSELN